jgi:hypothetical protein
VPTSSSYIESDRPTSYHILMKRIQLLLLMSPVLYSDAYKGECSSRASLSCTLTSVPASQSDRMNV